MRFLFALGALLALVQHVFGAEVGAEVGAEAGAGAGNGAGETSASASPHTNNWAVLVSTSRFWFNYRHMANVLSFYRTVKRLGIPDSQVIVMLSDDVACNPRNPYVGSVFKDHEHDLDVYGSEIEVDYRGYEVTVENFIRLLTDRWEDDVPRSKRLMSDEHSNVLVYMTGHGGDDFLKFQDAEEIGAWDLANAFGQMWEKRRYKELLFMIDTCEANTMYSKMYSPNIIAVGSSQFGESSLANASDDRVGVALIDRFTSLNLQYLEQVDINSKLTLKDLFDSYDPVEIESHPGIRTDLFPRPLSEVRITDFFGNTQNAVVNDPETNIDVEFRSFQSRHASSSSRDSDSDSDSDSERKDTPPRGGSAKISSSNGNTDARRLQAEPPRSAVPLAVCALGVLGLLVLGSQL